MNNSIFEIGTQGIDTNKIVEKIQDNVADKIKNGYYTDARIARAERSNLENIKTNEDFLTFYLECLREAVFVDISDFEIFERRTKFSRFFIAVKRFTWKLLKFYTYRLWSQQNQVNGFLLSAIEGTLNGYRNKIKDLEDRIAKLESKNEPTR